MLALASEGAAHRHTPADFAPKTAEEKAAYKALSEQAASREFSFEKDSSGTWTITATVRTESSNNAVFMSITTSPPATLSTGGEYRAPKSMTIYSGRAPADGTENSDTNGTDAASAQRIGTAKCHETLSLRSDVVLNSHKSEMDRSFTSATGLGGLEWSSDLQGAAEKSEAGQLRSMMLLRATGESSGGGRLLCRVLREEQAGGAGPAAHTGDDVDHVVAGGKATADDKQGVSSRHTWRFTKGRIQIYSPGEELTEGQVQELVAAALIELERRARMQGNSVGAGGSRLSWIGSSLFRSVIM